MGTVSGLRGGDIGLRSIQEEMTSAVVIVCIMGDQLRASLEHLTQYDNAVMVRVDSEGRYDMKRRQSLGQLYI